MKPVWRGRVTLGAFWSRQRLVAQRRLLPVRTAWSLEQRPYASPIAERLLAIEKIAKKDLASFIACARDFSSGEEVDAVGALNAAAMQDLVAGCELARLGFIKQAYTLWRSWFEQSLFALYFIESPIHRQAWKVTESVKIGDKPAHRLMLHQLINESSSEKHPFTQVYSSRFDALNAALKVSNIPKDKRISRRGEHVLTILSQGVHGTFRPAAPAESAGADNFIEKYGLGVLQEAVDTLALYWLCYLTSLVDLDEQALGHLKAGSLSIANPNLVELDSAERVVDLNASFARIFGA